MALKAKPLYGAFVIWITIASELALYACVT